MMIDPFAAPISLGRRLRPPVLRIASSLTWRAPMLWIAAGLAALAITQMGALAVPGLDPVSSTVSDLYYAPGGGYLFPLAGVLTLVGGVILTRRLAGNGRRAVTWTLLAWCLALALSTVFPTDAPGAASLSTAAQIHRWSAAVMFVLVPLAGVTAARHLPAAAAEHLRDRSRWCAAAGLTNLLFSVKSLLPSSATVPPISAVFELRGLAERVLFVTMIGVLGALASSSSRGAARVSGSVHRSPAPRVAAVRSVDPVPPDPQGDAAAGNGSYLHCAAPMAQAGWTP